MINILISPNRKRGLSLIEVMASVLIMGTLVASMLTSMAGSVRQISTHETQLTASHLARELLAEWTLRKEDLTVTSSGKIDSMPEWSWSRSAQPREVRPGITISEVTLAIQRNPDGSQTDTWRRDFKVWINESSARTTD